MKFSEFLNEKTANFMLSYRISSTPDDREVKSRIGKLGKVTFWDYDGGGTISVMVKFTSKLSLEELQNKLQGTVTEE